MERVRKVYFDALAMTKAQIYELLETLPSGSAHPFSSERVLLCRTEHGVEEIDISSYPEDYFFNAVDLGAMGETLLKRMAGFKHHLSVFQDFQILQAPASTFEIPIVSDQITILAVSERTPTYYDFCFADASCNACCWLARNTFQGITHSGDILNGNDLLDFVRINKDRLTDKEICVFISGYQTTQITRFQGTHPALLVANHVDKILYIIPVPLDAATIGDATICCPLVIKGNGDSLICSILPTATTDRDMMCHSNKLESPCFAEAIQRADFTISSTSESAVLVPRTAIAREAADAPSERLRGLVNKEHAIITTDSAIFPSFVDLASTQMIRFGTGLEFILPDEKSLAKEQSSTVVLPCIFGSLLSGPLLLATGTVPTNVPFRDEEALRSYYEQLKSVVVIVDDRMTDNARNLATSYRINALFIVQITPEGEPKDTDDVLKLLDSVNINAVTALAGPQSLVLVQVFDRYYFYRGLANRAHLNTTKLAFGTDITSIIESAGAEPMTDPRVKRLIDLENANTIILPSTGQLVRVQDLQKLFEDLSVNEIQAMEEDITAAIPQLQILLNQKDLQDLSQSLVAALSAKIGKAVSPMRDAYVNLVTENSNVADPELVKKKNDTLGLLRYTTKELQKALEPVISSLASIVSVRTTSKRTYDLKRLVRQSQIRGNVEAAKSMTFETLSGYLETYAEDMGVMLLKIKDEPYRELLGGLKNAAIDASPCCDLDSRVLHLQGLDAGIIMEQSQSYHDGPLRSQLGPNHPLMALANIGQHESGSTLAWVCWDEFVDLESPYTVRWMEKCNETHIAALRIIMRGTLSHAVASREHNLQPGSPEIGNLMGTLLMTAMSKLAAMRTTTPDLVAKAEDTVTRLMRGLFGNLLTIAGSGVRPLSMVWQLFGLNPQYDLPTTAAEWVWYETVVALYPYTGWPLEQFYNNLEKLLDKAIVRVVTKSEDIKEIKSNRTQSLIRYCKLRNIQLDHSRTIITIFMRMLTEKDVDIAAVATRLLEHLPPTLERQTQSYGKMIKYIKHLSTGGPRRGKDDLVAASIYTKRSAAFSELKTRVAEACQSNDWPAVKESCQSIMDKHAEIAALWNINPQSLNIQNITVYKDLLNMDLGTEDDPNSKAISHELTRLVLGDAERLRLPWQVGKEGQFGDTIESLNEEFLHEILTGEKLEAPSAIDTESKVVEDSITTLALPQTEDEFSRFKSAVQPRFISTMQKDLSPDDVCEILNIPVSAMRVFARALNPEFEWADLGQNFKMVVLDLLRNRTDRLERRPTKMLLGRGSGRVLQIEA
ncbi:hypothetical protein PFICI_11303 [Pestalotiopsis fici W106-1]|uniref:Uncharacterized protein n=1 Tax=Pestalotiopsis fici (strain W106-1 / CGMCC3.15140) TaxID=1229662 RepID=W3WUE7_PESFW|nr:uncharacterized protein PFICI_11303 [Pestalotiopsis fici W106-1]ETS77429.1 hypothetical protein PFICI_11303 [Pestalotiopsis fici W106-1]